MSLILAEAAVLVDVTRMGENSGQFKRLHIMAKNVTFDSFSGREISGIIRVAAFRHEEGRSALVWHARYFRRQRFFQIGCRVTH